ncbi:MAG TPA: SDR family NAD(P)-dependent oxidoreductase [Bryobacteraceae bacterium]|jgi:short-subunit dehydrogenase
MTIADSVIIVTGASDGIGAELARILSKLGARLALNARNETKLRAVVPEAADPLIVAGDITDDTVRKRIIEESIARFGRIDAVINNAGAGLYAPAWEVPLDAARMLMELNFFAPLALAQLAAPHMRRRKSGMIVNVGSIAGKITLPWFTLYSVSKYALGSLTEGLRMELKRDGIHAMIVCPGYVATGFQQHILGGKVPESIARARGLAITAERCARDIVRGMEAEKRTVLTPKLGWLMVAASRMVPAVMQAQLTKIHDRQHPQA